jgi:hypothetical protein
MAAAAVYEQLLIGLFLADSGLRGKAPDKTATPRRTLTTSGELAPDVRCAALCTFADTFALRHPETPGDVLRRLRH